MVGEPWLIEWLGTAIDRTTAARAQPAPEGDNPTTGESERSTFTRKEETMNCLKCGGYMIIDRVLDFYAKEAKWRCINCGATKDTLASLMKARNTSTASNPSS